MHCVFTLHKAIQETGNKTSVGIDAKNASEQHLRIYEWNSDYELPDYIVNH